MWLGMAAGMIAIGIYLSPKLLIELGPMRASLTSAIDSVRRSTLIELKLLKASCIIAGVALAVITLSWERIASSRWIILIDQHRLPETDRYHRNRHWLNPSFGIMSTLVGVAAVYLVSAPHLCDDHQLLVINAEDGVIEWATAWLFLLSGVGSFLLATRFKPQRNRFITHLLLGILFVVMFGEEISWGQRLFHFHTLKFFAEYNVQHENNLHNLMGYFADHLFMLGIFIYGFVIPLLCYRSEFIWKALDLPGIPIASPGLALGFLMSFLTQNWIVYRVIAPVPHLGMPELRELFAALAFALLMWECRLLIPSRPPSPQGPPP